MKTFLTRLVITFFITPVYAEDGDVDGKVMFSDLG